MRSGAGDDQQPARRLVEASRNAPDRYPAPLRCCSPHCPRLDPSLCPLLPLRAVSLSFSGLRMDRHRMCAPLPCRPVPPHPGCHRAVPPAQQWCNGCLPRGWGLGHLFALRTLAKPVCLPRPQASQGRSRRTPTSLRAHSCFALQSRRWQRSVTRSLARAIPVHPAAPVPRSTGEKRLE